MIKSRENVYKNSIAQAHLIGYIQTYGIRLRTCASALFQNKMAVPLNMDNTDSLLDDFTIYNWQENKKCSPIVATEIRGKNKSVFEKEKVAETLCDSICGLAGITLAKETQPKKIFIRKSYLDYTATIVKLLNKTTTMRKAIVGTPQIGKSNLLSFMLAHIPTSTNIRKVYVVAERTTKQRNDKKSTPTEYFASIMYFSDKCEDVTLCGENELLAKCYKIPIFELSDLSRIADEELRDDTLIMYDGFSSPPYKVGSFARCLLFSSQGLTTNASNNVEVGIEGNLYLGPWKKEELVKFSTSQCDIKWEEEYGTTEEMWEWWGGLVGYWTKKEQSMWRSIMYISVIERHIDDHNEDVNKIMNPDSDKAKAALVQLKPKDNGNSCERDWITDKVEEALEWSCVNITANKRWRALQEKCGAEMGYAFENYLGTKFFIIQQPLNIDVYPNYSENDKTWYVREPEKLELEFSGCPRLIQHEGTVFPMKFGILHRLSDRAPAIDFYIVQKLPGNAVKYKIHLIQATVGISHSAKFDAIEEYMKKMNQQIVDNKHIREEIKRLEQSGVKEDEIQAKQMKLTHRYVVSDAGEDLELPLLHADVLIDFMYLQPFKEIQFKGQKPQYSPKTRPLLAKLKCTYGNISRKGTKRSRSSSE